MFVRKGVSGDYLEDKRPTSQDEQVCYNLRGSDLRNILVGNDKVSPQTDIWTDNGEHFQQTDVS